MAEAMEQPRARFRLHQSNVAAVEVAIDGHVGSEVGLIDRLARGRFGLRDIAGVDRSIGGRVANQKTHRRRNVAGVVLRIEHIIQLNREILLIGDAGSSRIGWRLAAERRAGARTTANS